MKWFERSLFLMLIPIFTLLGEEDDDNDSNQMDALRDWITTKRQVTVSERGGSLSISGDMRVEFITINEQVNGVKNVGSNSNNPLIPADQFDVEFNLMLDYRTDYGWASIKLEFDNNMGLVGGTFNKLTLERSFMGFRIFEGDQFTIDLEIGRRRLSYTFDSRLEFGSYMDGLLVKYNQSSDKIGDFYIYGGPFVVNETKDQFAYVVETGLFNIANTGLYGKYSLIRLSTNEHPYRCSR